MAKKKANAGQGNRAGAQARAKANAKPKANANPKAIGNPQLLSVQQLQFVGPNYLLRTADGTGHNGGTKSVKLWVYTTFLPAFSFPPPSCAIIVDLQNGTWTARDVPSPQADPTGTTPNTLVVWHFTGTNGTGNLQSQEWRYFFGKS